MLPQSQQIPVRTTALKAAEYTVVKMDRIRKLPVLQDLNRWRDQDHQ